MEGSSKKIDITLLGYINSSGEKKVKRDDLITKNFIIACQNWQYPEKREPRLHIYLI